MRMGFLSLLCFYWLGFSPFFHTLGEKCIVRLLTGDTSKRTKNAQFPHEQGHNTEDLRVVARSFGIDDAEQMVLFNALCNSPLVVHVMVS